MAVERHLANAPITEAVVDFRVKLPKDFSVKQFAVLEKRLHTHYPIMERAWEHQVELSKLKSQPQFTAETRDRLLRGFFFRAEDRLNVAQFRRDGFSFSRLKPYTSWQEVFPEALKLWKVYAEIARPELITRVAVRYINHLKLQLQLKELSHYLTATPAVPEDAPQTVSGFLTRVVVSDLEQGISVNITQSLEKSIESGSGTVILDIDVYKVADLAVDDKRLNSTFEKLHTVKNATFFSSITEATARLYE